MARRDTMRGKRTPKANPPSNGPTMPNLGMNNRDQHLSNANTFAQTGRPGIAPMNAMPPITVAPETNRIGTQQQPRLSPAASTAIGLPPVVGAPEVSMGPDSGARGLGTVRRQINPAMMGIGAGFGAEIGAAMVMQFATKADEAPPWGAAWHIRDRWLRTFWTQEPFLAGAIVSMAMKYSNMETQIRGPKKVIDICQENLHACEDGKGWNFMMMKFLQDVFTQDNGGFLEVVRVEDDPAAPWVTFNHLDAGRCIRTGNRDQPVMYQDLWGTWHRLRYYQVFDWCEVPSSIEIVRGIGLSAVTRILRMAQVMRDTIIYNYEKVSGRFNRAVHLVSGVQKQVIADSLKDHAVDADNMNLLRYIQPAIIASLDPNAKVAVATIPLAEMPENFDWDKWLRWYITAIALDLGGDYQDIAPLPTSGFSGQGSARMIHEKSRGKGTENFTNTIEHLMNYRGIMPRVATFSFVDQDNDEAMQNIELAKERSQKRQIDVMAGVHTPDSARLEAIADGDLDPDLFTGSPETVAWSSLPHDTPPGAFPGGPMRTGAGGTGELKAPESQPPTNEKSPEGGNPTRIARTQTSVPKNNASAARVVRSTGSKDIEIESNDSNYAVDAVVAHDKVIELHLPAPEVQVTVSPPPAPIVNIDPPVVHVLPTEVNMPSIPAPIVNVEAPSVNVEAPKVVNEGSKGLKTALERLLTRRTTRKIVRKLDNATYEVTEVEV